MMLRNLAVGLPTMLGCLLLQATVTFWSVRYYLRQFDRSPLHVGWIAGIRPLLMVMIIMVAGNFLQMAIWASLFLFLGEFDDAYQAIYHSAVNFTSLGYGDVVMSESWKLLGPLEAATGVVMFGLTAAALMAVLQHVVKLHLIAEGRQR